MNEKTNNLVADKLEAAVSSAPYAIEKQRYREAVAEIRRLQSILDQLTIDEDPGEKRTHPGNPWHADEDDDCVRIFRGEMQIIKAPKRGTPYQEYWPTPEMIQWMLETMNSHDDSQSNVRNN